MWTQPRPFAFKHCRKPKWDKFLDHLRLQYIDIKIYTCLFSISIYRYILASPGGMQSPFLRLGLSPAATATARWRNRASIAIYPWKQDQYISWSEIVFTYCGVITNVQATSESVCYLSFWRDKLTSGLHRRYSVFLWYFIPMLKNVQGALLPET